MASLALCALLAALGALHRGVAAPPPNALGGRPGRAQEDPEALPGRRKRAWATRGYGQIEFLTGDYEGDYGESTSPSSSPSPWEVGPMARCDYDPCAHLQVPCPDLQRVSACLCPGASGEDVVPEQPRLFQAAGGASGTTADISWCAPPSAVDAYRLVYRPLGAAGAGTSTQALPDRSRLFTLQGLSPGAAYRVCVVASNRAGDSRLGEGDWGAEEEGEAPPGYGPCATFATASPGALTLHVTLAVVVLLLLLLLGLALAFVLVLRRRRSAAPEPSIGLQNPSYEEDKVFRIQS